jgi:voltage-gated potassium channel
MGLRRRRRRRRPLRVHPEFHRHLLLACLAVISSWVLPGRWIQISSVGFIYLTGLLGLRLGPFNRAHTGHRRLDPLSRDTHYLLLAIATVITQVLWLFNPASLGISGIPLLALFTLFIAWSMLRLLGVLARERRIDRLSLYGATAGYLLLGISGGLLLTVLDSEFPGGFYDNFARQALSMPEISGVGGERVSWDLNYGRLNYFAFVSLTTVGYGDITPVIPATRLACMALSVLGPLYIAVVLGVLISRLTATETISARGSAQLQGTRHPQEPPPPAPSPAPAPPGRRPPG